MQATWQGLVVLLSLWPPGALYYWARARALKSADTEPPSTDRGRPDSLQPMTMVLGLGLELLAATIVVLSFWLILWIANQQTWLTSLQFATSLPNLGPLPHESWDNAYEYVHDYVESHWVLLGIAAGVAYLLALVLAWFMGRSQGKKKNYQEKIQRQADKVSNARFQDYVVSDQSQVMIRLKDGTVYSGNLSEGSRRRPAFGKEELILVAPIKVRIKGIDKNLYSESLAVAKSEIASLSLLDGNQNRLFLYSDAVPPPWLPSDIR